MSTNTNNEVEIWARVINPDQSDMSEPAATTVLGWSFNDEAMQRMEQLASRNSQGTLSDSERKNTTDQLSQKTWRCALPRAVFSRVQARRATIRRRTL